MTKYHLIYQNLIDKCQILQDIRKKSNEYFELHHIVPRCIGGDNNSLNLILLTAREHFVAHHLLYLMYDGEAKSKMAHAWFCMCRKSDNQNRYLNSYQYELAKKAHSIAVSKQFKNKKLDSATLQKRKGGNNPNAKPITIAGITFSCISDAATHFKVHVGIIKHFKKGLVSELYVTDSDYRKEIILNNRIIANNKISKANTGKFKGVSYENRYGVDEANRMKKIKRLAMLGKKLSYETKAKIAASHIGMATRPKGFVMSDEQKQNISKSKKGRSVSIKNYIVTDPSGTEYIIIQIGIRAWWKNKFSTAIPQPFSSVKTDAVVKQGRWKGWKIKIITNEIRPN